jgi:hypothetical protein
MTHRNVEIVRQAYDPFGSGEATDLRGSRGDQAAEGAFWMS